MIDVLSEYPQSGIAKLRYFFKSCNLISKYFMRGGYSCYEWVD